MTFEDSTSLITGGNWSLNIEKPMQKVDLLTAAVFFLRWCPLISSGRLISTGLRNRSSCRHRGSRLWTSTPPPITPRKKGGDDKCELTASYANPPPRLNPEFSSKYVWPFGPHIKHATLPGVFKTGETVAATGFRQKCGFAVIAALHHMAASL